MVVPKREVVLGLVQMTCDEDPSRNLDKAVTKIEEAAKDGAQIVSLQELFSSRYFCQSNDDRYFDLAEPLPGRTTKILAKIAREKRVVIVLSLFEKEKRSFYNTACVIDDQGRNLGKYRKLHIPDDLANHYSELYYFKPGNLGLPVFKTRYAKIGLQVCWDQWFPEGARSLALKGAEIIFYPTAIGWLGAESHEDVGQTEFNAWQTVQRGHAISNNVFVAVTNRTGREDHIQFWGGSFVADPMGRVLKEASHDHEETLITICDLGRIAEVRKDWPFLKCRRKDQYFILK
jgi:N-carbamoylputrescine amidase